MRAQEWWDPAAESLAEVSAVPLVAVHDHHGRVDATDVPGELWRREIHRRGVPLRCPECRHRMVAAVSMTGLRHFRHYRRPGRCELFGETPTHLAVKREVLTAVRSVPGWRADPEVAGEGWRADVLAVGRGRRIAWEVQVSSLGEDTATQRTARLTASGVEVCWLPTAARHALAELPRAQIQVAGEGSVVVCHAEVYEGRWAPVRVDLAQFVVGVCRGSVFWAADRPLSESGAWTTTAHLTRAGTAAEQRAAELDQWRRDEHARRRPPVRYRDGEPEERVRRLLAWQRRVRRGWDAPYDPPPG